MGKEERWGIKEGKRKGMGGSERGENRENRTGKEEFQKKRPEVNKKLRRAFERRGKKNI